MRILIADDSPLIRTILSDMLKQIPDVEIVGMAHDGEQAVQMAESLKPDLMTLDVEMPRKTGLQALEIIMAKSPLPVIMVSSLTAKGTGATLKALELGAFDFVCKPADGAISQLRNVNDELISKVLSARKARVGQNYVARQVKVASSLAKTDTVVAIASSTGGPKALVTLFKSLPKGFSAPIVMVQHMPAGFTATFADRLNAIGTVACREAKSGDTLTNGVALMAPGGHHMTVQKGGKIQFDDRPLLHGVRPAADYLFESVAQVYGAKVLGIVLTGMGRDGAKGAVEIRNAGGTVFAEDESTCAIYGMPKAAVSAGGVDAEFPIDQMAGAIVAGLTRRLTRAS